MIDHDSNCAEIRDIIMDFDGVLTDNRVLVSEDGTEAVLCNRADGLGCDMFRRAGIGLFILSTETNPVVAARARKLKVPVVQGCGDKAAWLASWLEGRDPGGVAYVGNDTNDLEAMRLVGWPIAPADAHPAILAIARLVTRAGGGAGVMRELADIVLGV